MLVFVYVRVAAVCWPARLLAFHNDLRLCYGLCVYAFQIRRICCVLKCETKREKRDEEIENVLHNIMLLVVDVIVFVRS